MTAIAGIVIGLLVGTPIGVLVMALCVSAAGRNDRRQAHRDRGKWE